ncbi:MAG: DNA gyrase subunit A [Clostridia bacterium]|nr:DNA gyrase subunit A [Clostridia bacterium]
MDEILQNQKIEKVEIASEMKRSYIDYSMSVIIGRALPDVRDGLKPVHRRILYAMHDDGLTHDKPFRKSATTVGNVLGHYHPHGDAAVYDTMVRMAQPFSLRYPLIEGHGNFGNVDGDGAAAYRYTEARMAKIADLMLSDIEKDVVDFVPNFDNQTTEPTVLPSRFPNLLVNGSVGIAVGMATNIPPHNLSEVVDGTIYYMDHPDCTIPELMQYIKGPDFPTSATIYGVNGIHQAYLTGRGRVFVRAKHHFEEKKGRTSIVFTEIPYQVNKRTLIESIADLINEKRIEGISDLRDETGRDGMRIVVDLKRDANPQIVLNLLFKYSQLQDTFAVNMLALVDGEPKTLNLKQILFYYVKHQEEVIVRRTRFELDKARARLHILEGYKKAIDAIDAVIALIRSSRTIPEARERLVSELDFTEIQAQAIVELPLGRLAGLEIEKILAEMEEKIALCQKLEGILADRAKVLDIIREDLIAIKDKYGDARRTAIEEAEEEIVLEDLIERHKCVITITNTGYIKRIPADTYQAQNRGGKGITAMGTKEEDFVKDIFVSHSHNYLFMFTSRGKLFVKKCYEIPEASRTAKGTNIVNILNLEEGETVTAFISVGSFATGEYLTMVTRGGVIKRTELALFRHVRKSGIKAIKLDEGDELLSVHKTDGECEILLAASNGLGTKFHESRVRLMGRVSRGVRGMRLAEGAKLVGSAVVKPDENGNYDRSILTITSRGFGKRTDPSMFPLRSRGGKGVICHKLSAKNGSLAGIAAVADDDDILLITDGGTLIRTEVCQISVTGRATGGVIVMRLAADATLIGFQRLEKEDAELEETPEMSAEEEQALEADSAAENENETDESAEDEAEEEDLDEEEDEEEEDEEGDE